MTAELEALRRALPCPDRHGKRWGVMVRNSTTPDVPLAVFQYEDHAYAFAIAEYGKFDGFRFAVRSDIEVVPVGQPAVEAR